MRKYATYTIVFKASLQLEIERIICRLINTRVLYFNTKKFAKKFSYGYGEICIRIDILVNDGVHNVEADVNTLGGLLCTVTDE